MPSLTIRPLNARDEADWLTLWADYLTFYKAELPAKVGPATFARMLDPNGDVHGLGAFGADGKMLGMATFLFHPTTWSDRERCYMNDLFTVPEARGKGVGGALIEAVYAAADAAGAPSVYWLTQDFNHTARQLYDRIGTKSPFIKYTRS